MEKFCWSSSSDTQVFNSIRMLLKDAPYLLDYLFHPYRAKLNAAPKVIIKDAASFSHGEQLLIKAAIDLWSYDGKASLGEVITSLDYNNMLNLLNALCYARDINEDLIDLLDRRLTLGHRKLPF